jgi:hypothetical protein
MKTAVNQLIEQMQSYSYKVSKEGNLDMVAAFDYAIGIAKKYKEKEKEQIIDAYYGNIDGVFGYTEAGEQYYNQTYNQNK